MLNRVEEVFQVRMFYSKIKKEGTIKVVLLGGLTLCDSFMGEKSENFMIGIVLSVWPRSSKEPGQPSHSAFL